VQTRSSKPSSPATSAAPQPDPAPTYKPSVDTGQVRTPKRTAEPKPGATSSIPALANHTAARLANWGHPIGTVEFKADALHDVRSVTKSIVSLLYGIALAQVHVPDPDQSLPAQFREYPERARDANKARLTIAHALTMTLALEWSDDVPSQSVPTEVAMESAGSLSLHS
jgi:hypothetical protein